MTKLPAALNGLFIFAACAAFTAMSSAVPLQRALLSCLPSFALAAATGFVAIDGLGAFRSDRVADVWLCVSLATFWTGAQAALAIIMLATVAKGALHPDMAPLLIVATGIAQSALLATLTVRSWRSKRSAT